MEHIHLDSCESTQKYLIEMIKENNSVDETLVSCDTQTSGVGQKSNSWDSYASSLCQSFTARENSKITLTPLEMGVLVCHFFKSVFNQTLKLKWPNDILNEQGEKVGGILINKSGNSPLIVGIGLNLFSEESEDMQSYDYKAGFIFPEKVEIKSKKDLSYRLVKFISENRLTSEETIKNWNLNCAHIDHEVIVSEIERDHKTCGVFLGIGENGQALVRENSSNKGQTHELYSGSLRIKN